MKLKINNVRISLRQEQTLEQAVCRKCGIPRDALGSVRIVRKAVDARKKMISASITMCWQRLKQAADRRSACWRTVILRNIRNSSSLLWSWERCR